MIFIKIEFLRILKFDEEESKFLYDLANDALGAGFFGSDSDVLFGILLE